MQSQYYQVVVVGSISHSIAIVTTVFRLGYRAWMRRFWWEDAWATLALISDCLCFMCVWHSTSSNSWILPVGFTCVLWSSRMSMIFSIIRVGNPLGSNIYKQITYSIAASFACMWIALLVLKLKTCLHKSCPMAEAVALSQLLTDILADISLVAAPLFLWKNVGLSRNRKILVISVFGASLLITVITIPQSILLFKPIERTTLVFSHVKAALSLVICNLLVIVTFAYRVGWKERCDLDQSFPSTNIFTSVIVAPVHYSMNTGTALSTEEGMVSKQVTPAPVKTTKTNLEDDISIEDDQKP